MQDSSFKSPADVHQTITRRIIEAIEAGAGEFVMPWHHAGPDLGRPTNAETGKRYQGTNVVALWAEGMLKKFSSGHWATYRQWQGVGAQVRRGERSAVVVFYKKLDAADDEGSETPSLRMVARASRVFNADQVDGWSVSAQPDLQFPAEELPTVEAFVAATKAKIRSGGNMACYRLQHDWIDLPARSRFVGTPTSTPTESYYATLLHELVHWTGAKHRLDRTFGAKFGDAAYAAEELVAELGAAFLCADLKVSNEPRPDHAAYVNVWLQILEADPRAIFTAARLADQASKYLFELPGGNAGPTN
jgi:antirestriction protein ArdC